MSEETLALAAVTVLGVLEQGEPSAARREHAEQVCSQVGGRLRTCDRLHSHEPKLLKHFLESSSLILHNHFKIVLEMLVCKTC